MSEEHRPVPPLVQQCQLFHIKYIHNLVWRSIDPPSGNNALFKPVKLPVSLPFTLPQQQASTTAKQFRGKLSELRRYLSRQLVPAVCGELAQTAAQFVMENRLKVGNTARVIWILDPHWL